MLLLNTNDVAISIAANLGTLVVEESIDRFGNTYFAVGDDHGVIEICATRADADLLVGGAPSA